MSDGVKDTEDKPRESRGEVEILAQALADSNENASRSNSATVRVLGGLLAFSVLGNIALAGLQIRTTFFGQDISMGGSGVAAEAPMPDRFASPLGYEVPLEEWGYFDDAMEASEEMSEPPDFDWCMGFAPEKPPVECLDAYPELAGE